MGRNEQTNLQALEDPEIGEGPKFLWFSDERFVGVFRQK
jgi:hypothetical protein